MQLTLEDIYAKHSRGETLSVDDVAFLFSRLAEKSSNDIAPSREMIAKVRRLDLLETRLRSLKEFYAHLDDVTIEKMNTQVKSLVREAKALRARPTLESLVAASEAAQTFCEGYMFLVKKLKEL
jgi:ABC-type ATPase with predicted acetyltransferase domain